ncbi:YgcG family protein [Dongia sp.]|uniref:TPM domain-containing protein n=1 Tax=Dongia sp. TaxID=1977262 RepID=UPI0035B3D2F8
MVKAVRNFFAVFLLSLAVPMLGAATCRAGDPPLPALTGRVVDRADILSSSTEAALAAKIDAHEKATTDQIVIVTLPDLMGRPIADWGLMLGRGWGIGQKGKDNGIVFLIAPNERELRIEVGYGLEGSLPDATANEIIQSDIIPHFKQGDMEAGVVAGLDAILAVLGGTYQPLARPLSDNGTDYAPIVDTLVPIFFFIAFAGVGISMNLRRRWDKTRNRYVWYIARSTGSSSGFSSFGRSGGGFSGGGGSFGGGGASGKW